MNKNYKKEQRVKSSHSIPGKLKNQKDTELHKGKDQ
jgi:hypothetical protein